MTIPSGSSPRPVRRKLTLLAATPMVLAFLAMVRWPVMAPCTLLDLFGISVLAGVGEEMLFRGLMQDVFAGWLPVWLALVLASMLFGMMHAVTLPYAVMAGLMGAYPGRAVPVDRGPSGADGDAWGVCFRRAGVFDVRTGIGGEDGRPRGLLSTRSGKTRG